MKRYEVIDWWDKQSVHICRDETGKERRIDFYADGGLDDKWADDPNELIGKVILADYDHPYISIAANVRLDETETRNERTRSR